MVSVATPAWTSRGTTNRPHKNCFLRSALLVLLWFQMRQLFWVRPRKLLSMSPSMTTLPCVALFLLTRILLVISVELSYIPLLFHGCLFRFLLFLSVLLIRYLQWMADQSFCSVSWVLVSAVPVVQVGCVTQCLRLVQLFPPYWTIFCDSRIGWTVNDYQPYPANCPSVGSLRHLACIGSRMLPCAETFTTLYVPTAVWRSFRNIW